MSGRPPLLVIYGRPKTSSRYRVVPTPCEGNRRKAARASEFPGILVNTVISLASDMWIIRGNGETLTKRRRIFFFSSLIISSCHLIANLDQWISDLTVQ